MSDRAMLPRRARSPLGDSPEEGDLVVLASDLIVDCSKDELITRQEFKGEVDVNNIRSRHGVGNFMARPEVFGEHDFDLDLQTAIAVTDQARDMWQRLPVEIRVKYGSLEEVRSAMDRGELVPPQPAAAAGGSSPAAGAGSPSDSAAGTTPKA